KRRSPAAATSSMRARWWALAPGTARCGGSAAGARVTGTPNASAAARAMARWPQWTGSKVPPYQSLSMPADSPGGREQPGGGGIGDCQQQPLQQQPRIAGGAALGRAVHARGVGGEPRSEEHTSELQSRENLVCRLLLDKK